MEIETMTTTQALEYIRVQTGKSRSPHKQQLNRWQSYGWIERHTVGIDGGQNTYTIVALDALCEKINSNYRGNRKLGLKSKSVRSRALYSRVYVTNQRARNKLLPNTFTDFQWQNALNYFNGCCAVCERQLNDMFGAFAVSADHWIPLSYEGEDNPGSVADNIVPLCHGVDGCNNSKKDIMPTIWLEQEFSKRKAKRIAARVQQYFDSLEENNHE